MKFSTRQRLILIIIIIAFLALGISYVSATPPLESSDEYKHYPFVQHLQTQGRLPVLDPDNPGIWLQEAAQPPLYYMLMAAVTIGIDTADLPMVHHKNPQAFIGNPGQIGNKNLIIHNPQNETFPWHGTVLAIYIIRFVSLVLGGITILVTALLGQRLFNAWVGLLAAALTAFNPMFLFVSAAVNNDSLAILLGSLGLFLLVLIWREVPDPRLHWWRYVVLGMVLGLGILTKLSLGGLLALTGLAFTWLAWRERDWRILIGGDLLVLVPVLLFSAWWFVRNWNVYGDPTGLEAFFAVQGTRANPLAWAGWLDEFGTFGRSFWGLFGGVNVAAPEWYYLVMNGLALVAFAGIVKWFWSEEARAKFVSDGVWLLAAWSLILFLLLIRWNIIFPAFQGRLVFPALSAINVLGAVGFLVWFKNDRQPRMATILGGGMFLLAALLPLITIRPAYAYPQPLIAIPPVAEIDPVIFSATDGQLQLVGVEMESNQNVRPDGVPVIVILYWQAVNPVATNYVSSVHLLGRGLESVGQIDRYPAMGMIPTNRWEAGAIYRDLYHVTIDNASAAPSQLRVAVSLYNVETDQTLPASNTQGIPIDPLFVGSPVRLAGAAQEPPEMDVVINALFEQGITLAGANGTIGAPGETIPMTLYWQAANTPDQDFTVFVHLLDQNGDRIAGADAPPVNNYYPTSMWRAGDLIDDLHYLAIPQDLDPGVYKIVVGLYDPISNVRLS